MKVYVVMRSEGEYSDRRLWIQTVFLSWERAMDYVEDTDEKVREFFVKHDDRLTWDCGQYDPDLVKEWNAITGGEEESVPYSRPTFYVEEVEVQV
jgi:hypothetical protein